MQNLLDDWLERIKNQHRKIIDLDLKRVRVVADRLGLLKPAYPIIIVGGTNGKGSTVAGLEAILLAAGYRVGAFTSPYLYRFNELVRVQGKAAQDEDFIQAFELIEKTRGDITLTQFEFNTLAALFIFQHSQLDVGILEVGLGGRLDAVNILDADVSVVTSIAIDHADWLGDTREKIAVEKAGIFRAGVPAVCGDFDPPVTLLAYATERSISLFCQGVQFGFEPHLSSWTWWSQKTRLENLPLPHLALQNMSTVLMTIELIQEKLPVKRAAIDVGLAEVDLPGRIQVIQGEITQIFDVSHNPAAAEFLAHYLQQHKCAGKTHAVFSMLADKDILGTLYVMRNCIDEWYIAPLSGERGSSLSVLEYCFRTAQIKSVNFYPEIKNAYETALAIAQSNDRIVVFGSFHTVAEASS